MKLAASHGQPTSHDPIGIAVVGCGRACLEAAQRFQGFPRRAAHSQRLLACEAPAHVGMPWPDAHRQGCPWGPQVAQVILLLLRRRSQVDRPDLPREAQPAAARSPCRARRPRQAPLAWSVECRSCGLDAAAHGPGLLQSRRGPARGVSRARRQAAMAWLCAAGWLHTRPVSGARQWLSVKCSQLNVRIMRCCFRTASSACDYEQQRRPQGSVCERRCCSVGHGV